MRRLLLLAVLLSSTALGQPAAMRQFLFRLEPVRKDFTLQNMTETERPVIVEHAAYLKSLTEQGKLALAGQAFDPNGFWGIAIVNAPDAETATAMLNADPAIKSKMFSGVVIPFRIVFSRLPEARSNP
jgi:uncharacterized protein YciI